MSQHDDDDAPPHPKKAGEGWVVTFADMMSLLMSFFVLLLSFSEQDSAKFKEVGGSLENAFGVQRDIMSYQMLKGTSIVAREFSPGKPEPTAVQEVHQKTIDEYHQTVEYAIEGTGERARDTETGTSEKKYEQLNEKVDRAIQENGIQISKVLAKVLKNEIDRKNIEIEASKQRILIRILDQGSFASGDDSLNPAFVPAIDKIGYVLSHLPGQITVSGYTDNKPISNQRFHSNLELSTARATTVVHQLLQNGDLDPKRIVISGYGASHPLYPNDSEENRMRNRRVEIVINQMDVPEIKTVTDELQSNKKKPSADKISDPSQKQEIIVNQPTKPIKGSVNE